MVRVLKVVIALTIVLTLASCMSAPEVTVKTDKKEYSYGETVVLTIETTKELLNVDVYLLVNDSDVPAARKSLESVEGKTQLSFDLLERGGYSVLIYAVSDGRPIEYHFPDLFVVK